MKYKTRKPKKDSTPLFIIALGVVMVLVAVKMLKVKELPEPIAATALDREESSPRPLSAEGLPSLPEHGPAEVGQGTPPDLSEMQKASYLHSIQLAVNLPKDFSYQVVEGETGIFYGQNINGMKFLVLSQVAEGDLKIIQAHGFKKFRQIARVPIRPMVAEPLPPVDGSGLSDTHVWSGSSKYGQHYKALYTRNPESSRHYMIFLSGNDIQVKQLEASWQAMYNQMSFVY